MSATNKIPVSMIKNDKPQSYFTLKQDSFPEKLQKKQPAGPKLNNFLTSASSSKQGVKKI